MKFRPSGCSEFPNDNPEIHDGSVWVCSWTRARPRAVMRAKGSGKPPAAVSVEGAAPPQPCAALDECLDPAAVGSEGGAAVDNPMSPLHAETDPRAETESASSADQRTAPEAADSSVVSADPEETLSEKTLDPPPDDPFLSDLSSDLELAVHAPRTVASLAGKSHDPDFNELDAALTDDPFLTDLMAETTSVAPPEKQCGASGPVFESMVPPSRPHLSIHVGSLAAAQERSRRAPGDDDEWCPSADEVSSLAGDALADDCVPNGARSIGADTNVDASALEPALEQTADHLSFIKELTALAGSVEPARLHSDVDDLDASTESLSPMDVAEFFDGHASTEAPAPTPPPAPDPIGPLQLEDLSGLPNDGGWQQIVGSLATYLLQRGHTRAAALLPRLLEGQSVNVSRLPATVAQCLVAADIACETAAGFAIDDQFRIRARRMHRACVERRLDAPTIGGWLTPIVRALTATADSDEGVLASMRHAGVTGVIERVA